MLSFLPQRVKTTLNIFEDLPGYLNKAQLTSACEISPRTTMLRRKDIPKADLRIGQKYYWRIETVADYIYNYRVKRKFEVIDKAS